MARRGTRGTTAIGIAADVHPRGAGTRIAYTVVDSPVGRLLVAGTERGVAAVYVGDDDAPLVAALRGEYPKADVRPDEAAVGHWAAVLVAHLAGERRTLDLPLDVTGTAFQRRVWAELQAIPYGSTRTYQQVAEAIGRPTAARAVGRACAANPASILIPCHRMLRGDGDLAGYRWGLERKRALLDQERRRAERVTLTVGITLPSELNARAD
jgi:AraC family transcriptional regulator of adaptative response/methylated-DNA-[protein]-cysteine methyltransferase